MFEEPSEEPIEHSRNPADRAREKSVEFQMHAELAAVFEGNRKFEAQIIPGFDPQLIREIQKTFGRLEKSKSTETPVLPQQSIADATDLLNYPEIRELSTNDYHISRRPGEVMIARWLAGDEIETFYKRIQSHFDTALNGFREEERTSQEWKQDPQTLAYLTALDAVKMNMAERYLRDAIREHNIVVLSTQTADEMNIAYLCDYVMGVPVAKVVGAANAPPDEPTERDLAWFFKLFCLRGIRAGVEQMCFFTFLQKTDDEFGGDA
jgi:hypothetical protein